MHRHIFLVISTHKSILKTYRRKKDLVHHHFQIAVFLSFCRASQVKVIKQGEAKSKASRETMR